MTDRNPVTQTVRHLRTEIRGRSLAIAVVSSILFFTVLGLLPNLSIIVSLLLQGDLVSVAKVYGGLLQGIFTAAPWYASILLALLSILTGLNVALIINRVHRLRRAGVTGVGSFFGLMLGGCPSCATGLLPAFGVAGGLAFMPLGGSELSLFGIAILIVSLYWNANAERCRV